MEKDILNLFLYNHKLKFNEIEKQTKSRSNILAYYLNKLIQKKLIEKDNVFYKLSENSEKLIPYFTNKNSVISVVLIAIRKNKNIFLIKRNKRPFDDKLCLPGGRLVVGETITQATKRIMKEKFGIKCRFEKINSINLEHVKKQGKILHSFLLIFVSATTKQELNCTTLNGKKNRIVSSDYYLMKNNLDEEAIIKSLITR